jgi:hypothetical protein
MINGFDEETVTLTSEERLAAAHIAARIKLNVGEEKAVTAGKIINGMAAKGFRITEPRLRKIINHIRRTKMVNNLVATSKGYYVENDPEKLKTYIESLRQRASAIMEVADSYTF